MGIFSSDEEPCWSDVYNLQEHNRKYEAKIARLRTCLQEIKEIAERAFAVCDDDCGNANKFTEILDFITKAESEDSQ